MKILLTGATGFVGNVLFPMLLEKGYEVSVFCLPGEAIPREIESRATAIYRGNVTDKQSLEKAIPGHEAVIHLAGLISYWFRDTNRLRAINSVGAANVGEACADHGVKRLVHISSVGAIGMYKRKALADETTPFNWPEAFNYMTTKRDGEKALRAIGDVKGLDIVYVYPASIMGPGDPVPTTPHNTLYGNIFNSPFFFGSFSGGLAIVDVRDLAALIIASLEKGKRGEGYLAVGANVQYSEVLKSIGRHSGKRVIPFPIPSFLLTLAGALMEFGSVFTNKRPLLTAAYGRLSGWYGYYSSEKSKRELGVAYRDYEDTIRDGTEYYREKFVEKR